MDFEGEGGSGKQSNVKCQGQVAGVLLRLRTLLSASAPFVIRSGLNYCNCPHTTVSEAAKCAQRIIPCSGGSL